MTVEQFPAKRMAAGAAIRDHAGRLLIVEPTYRPQWLVPGGVVEADESPRQGCSREIMEELGLHLAVGRLLCVDYRPAEANKSESVQFIFDGGVLDDGLIEQIRLPLSELASFVFFAPDIALPMLDDHLARRMRFALVALADGSTYYLEDGCMP